MNAAEPVLGIENSQVFASSFLAEGCTKLASSADLSDPRTNVPWAIVDDVRPLPEIALPAERLDVVDVMSPALRKGNDMVWVEAGMNLATSNTSALVPLNHSGELLVREAWAEIALALPTAKSIHSSWPVNGV